MLEHVATVERRRIRAEPRSVVQHGVNSDTVRLDLDQEWGGLSDVRVVMSDGDGTSAVIPYAGDPVAVPRALMAEPGPLYLTVVGTTAGGTRVVTSKMRYPLQVVPSGELEGGIDPDDPGGGGKIPIATTESLGCVIVGDRLTVTPTGRLSGVAPTSADVGVEQLDNRSIDQILI